MNEQELQEQLEKLMVRSVWQDEHIDSLNQAVVHLQRTLELQQAQLRFLYQRLPENHSDDLNNRTERLNDDIPPHY